MRPKPSPERFAELQSKAREAREAQRDYGRELDRRYQDRTYAPRVKVHKYEVLRRAEDRAEARFYAYLKAISPRNWDHGIAASWLIDGLSYPDAVTRGPLSVVPPAAYGWLAHDPQFRAIIGAIPEVQANV